MDSKLEYLNVVKLSKSEKESEKRKLMDYLKEHQELLEEFSIDRLKLILEYYMNENEEKRKIIENKAKTPEMWNLHNFEKDINDGIRYKEEILMDSKIEYLESEISKLEKEPRKRKFLEDLKENPGILENMPIDTLKRMVEYYINENKLD